MEQRNNNRNNVIFEIESLLNKMSNQVNFLIRKEMTLNQLDVDLLMENTRKLYDTLCSVEIRESENQEIDQDFDEAEDIDEVEDQDINDDTDSGTDEDERVDMVWDFTNDAEESGNDENVSDEDQDIDNDFDDDEDETEVEDDDDVEYVDFDIEEDEFEEEVEAEDIDEDDKEDENESDDNEDSGIRAYRKINNEYFTLGDKLELSVDNSLGARLQRKPVADLMTAIGINDKFLFLNELFGGSMEKYNKSIRALNNFSTLLGAKTYMSELQIEFQWNCESEAYKKLTDLVERRFI